MAHLVCEDHKRRSVVIDGRISHRGNGSCSSKRVRYRGKSYGVPYVMLELLVLKTEGVEPAKEESGG